jgi:hypothetical protein
VSFRTLTATRGVLDSLFTGLAFVIYFGPCQQVSLNLESSAKKARKGKPQGGEYRHRGGASFSDANPYGASPQPSKQRDGA